MPPSAPEDQPRADGGNRGDKQTDQRVIKADRGEEARHPGDS
ncbi:hypothetical protein [Lentzea albidocapillata]|nr:hypothetical protein [Lentzea albidocapillata]